MSATIDAVRKTITVNASLETAFETFTRGISSWWPVETHSAFEDPGAEVVLEERTGGRLFERRPDGEEADWADVLAFERPSRIVLRWRVNPERVPTEIEITFTPEGDGTRVDLEHRGWDRAGDDEGRANYDAGWTVVLDRFAGAGPFG
jgi:uncharacterized protein YndB with AHSA1/START domain